MPLLAKENGHSVTTMLTKYAAWTEGATESDVQTIRAAMEAPAYATAPIMPPSLPSPWTPCEDPEVVWQ